MLSLLDVLRSRVLPAILTAAGVVLIAAGLLSYADPTRAGLRPVDSGAATAEPSVAILDPSPELSPSGPPSPSSAAPASPPGSAPASIIPDPAAPRAVATRVVIPGLGIDLPIVRGNRGYPWCNVAMYLWQGNADDAAEDAFGQPGEGRATYLYAHARDGMFGPIYERAIVQGRPRSLRGLVVQVYTSDLRQFLYEIRDYHLHSTSLDAPLSATTEQLWLQTSEGPKGTPGKTQLVAYPVSVGPADAADAIPRARPVACG